MQIGLLSNPTLSLQARADAIAIQLSEPSGQTVSWQLDVWAITDAGRTFVGTLYTCAASIGTQSNRLVGHAVCPGARSWAIEATGPAPAADQSSSTLGYLDAAPCAAMPPGLGAGVFYPQGRVLTVGGALAAARTDYSAPVRFRGFFGSNEGASTRWIYLFNGTTTGSLGLDGIALNVPAGGSFNLSLEDTIFCPGGFNWAISSSGSTFTADSGATFRVTTRAEW